MFHFIRDLLVAFFTVVAVRRKNLIFTLLILRKQNEILKRQFNARTERIRVSSSDRWSLAMILSICNSVRSHLKIFKPETVLAWQRRSISRRWTYPNSLPGRKSISREIRNLILNMKNDNNLWGCHRIADELKKLGIELHHTTVNRIIQDFRKKGRIAVSGSWSRFLKTHWDSMFAMDFMTIDTLLGKRFFLLIVLKLNTREIKYWDMTENPTKEFVRQRVMEIQDQNPPGMHLIHDNAPQFTAIDYRSYGINGINTSVAAPDMNAYAERFIRSFRQECLDWFVIFSEKHLRNILRSYMEYYNQFRPHQGISAIPECRPPELSGKIKRMPILFGLHNHYYRAS